MRPTARRAPHRPAGSAPAPVESAPGPRARVAPGARLVGGLVAAALLLVALVLALDVREAAGRLTAARDRLPELTDAVAAGDAAAVRQQVRAVQADAVAAHQATGGPLWSLAAGLPLVGDTPRAVRELTSSVEQLTREVLPELAAAADQLAPDRLLPEPDRVELAALTAAGAPLERARDRLADVPTRTRGRLVLPPVARARDELAADVGRLRRAVAAGLDASRLLPGALGADGPRRYFVAFQTNAESRGTGGLVGAYGILIADEGRVSVPELGDDTVLEPVRSTVDLGADYLHLYGRDPELWGNTNLSPHFPYAARRWLDVWQRRTGQRLDGAIATDPVGLSHLLRAGGPVALPGGEQVSGDDVVPLTEWDAYTRFEGREQQRKDFLVGVAGAVVRHLLDGSTDLEALAEGARELLEDGRLAVWSAHPEEQQALSGAAVAGEVPTDGAPYAAVVVNNAAANKLDYHLRREVDYELGACRAGRRDTLVRVRLTNGVPAGRLAAYASGRHDLPDGAAFVRGSHKLHLSLYATVGAGLVAAELDGVPQAVRTGQERGHPVFVVPVVLEPGQARTVVLRLAEPAHGGEVRVPVQPLVLPQQTRVRAAGCPLRERAVSGALGPSS